jgi:hypothetical protein
VHVTEFSSNESLIDFYASALNPSQLPYNASLERKAKPMQHKPCRLLRHPKSAVNLPRANAVLAANEQPESREPLLQRDRRILEDGADLNGELATAGSALPPLLSLEVVWILGVVSVAIGAPWAIKPTHSGHSVNANLFFAKVLNRLL